MNIDIDKVTVSLISHSHTIDQIEFDIPDNWSINKLKCLYITELPFLKFDEFQLCFEGKLLEGNQIIGALSPLRISNQKMITLQLKMITSKTAFSQYYQTSINKLFIAETIDHFPVLHPSIVYGDQMQNQIDGQQNVIVIDIFAIWKLIKYCAMYLLALYILSNGQYYQCMAISGLACLYCVLQLYKKYRRREQIFERYLQNLSNNYKSQKDHKAKIKTQVANQKQFCTVLGHLLIIVFKSLEILICFLMTLFPNWNTRDHLTLWKTALLSAKTLINYYMPNTYPPNSTPKGHKRR